MRQATQQKFSGRGTASLALCLFCFQFVRFYVVIPLDAYTCYSPDHIYGATASAAHGHDHALAYDGDQHDEAMPQSDDRHFYFQHCKDTLNGLGLTPVQPFGLPVLIWHQKLPASLVHVARTSRRVIEHSLSPPFQPPKNYS